MFEIIVKDLKIFIRDIKAVILALILPIALITLFALAFGGISGKALNKKPTEVLVTDLDSSNITRQIITELDTLDEIQLIELPLEQAKEKIKSGNNLALLVFYKGFNDSVNAGAKEPMELFYDEARKIEAGMLQYALISNLMKILGPKTIKNKVIKSIRKEYPGMSPVLMRDIEDNISGQFQGGNNMETFNTLKTTSLARKKSVNWVLIQSFAGTAVMMLLFSVSAMGASILAEKEDGTLKRLLYSPIEPLSIMFGKMIYSIIISVFQLVLMIIFSWLVLGLDISNNLFFLSLVVVSTAFACSGFGIFIASICTSRKQSESLGVIIILLMSAIGGSMIPLFIMPAIMRKVAVVSVNYWAIQGFYDVLGRDASFADLSIKLLVLIGIGVIMTAVSAGFFRRNILKVV